MLTLLLSLAIKVWRYANGVLHECPSASVEQEILTLNRINGIVCSFGTILYRHLATSNLSADGVTNKGDVLLFRGLIVPWAVKP